MESTIKREQIGTPTTLAGRPYDFGRSHGEQLKPQIAAFVNEYLYRSADVFGTPFESILDGARRVESHVAPEYLEEMEGIAHGAGATLDIILALNALVDISQILASQRKTCINVVAFGEASADGSLIHGRNTDFPCTDVLPRTATVFHCRPDKGYPYLSVAWAGFSGALTAMNSAGITVTEVGYIFDELQLEATPIALIVRRIAQYATTIDDAVAIVAESRRTAGFNLTVTDWKVPEARAIEFTATRYGVRSADRGLLVVSDNRLSRAMTKRQLAEPCGVARYIRALSLAEAERGSIDLDAMKRILRDRFDVLSYRMSDTVNCVCSRNTIQSVVFQPEQQTAWVSHNTIPAPTGEYVAYKLPA